MDLSLYKTRGFSNMSQQTMEDAVVKLTKRYLHEVPLSIDYAGGGAFGLAYFVQLDGRKIVIKAFRLEGMHRTQALETETLAGHCPIPMPATLFVHDKDDEVALDAIGMECMAGVPAVDINPRKKVKKKKKAMAEALTYGLHAIHQAHNDMFGFLENPVYSSWLDFYKPFAEEVYTWTMENGADPKHKMPQALLDAVQDSWSRFDDIFAEPVEEATLLHADLNVCNFMVDPKTLLPTALIDPWRSMWGDRDFDLHQLYNITGAKFYLYETYKNNYKVSRTCDLKCAFYALYNEIFCYMVSNISYEHIYPRMIKNLRKQMQIFLSPKA